MRTRGSPFRRLYAGALLRRCVDFRALCLTYDDGPGASLTPRLLEVLSEFRALATFFLLGASADQEPSLVDRIISLGHEVGCHGQEHLNAWKVSPRRAEADIASGYSSLSRWIPSDAAFRPPYGKLTPLTAMALRRRRAPVVMWTHDAGDTADGDLPAVSEVTDAVARDGGGVVLMHDFDRKSDPRNDAARAEYVLNLTGSLLRMAAASTFRVLTVRQLLRGTPS